MRELPAPRHGDPGPGLAPGYREGGTFSSSAGTAGSWTVRVVYSGADATVNFRVDKAN